MVMSMLSALDTNTTVQTQPGKSLKKEAEK